MALNRSDKSRILRRYFPGMTRNSEMSTEPKLLTESTASLCGVKPNKQWVKEFFQNHRAQFRVSHSGLPQPQPPTNGRPRRQNEKPSSFTFKDTTDDSVKTWKDVLVELCKLIYADPDRQGDFDRVMRIKGAKKLYFSRNSDDLDSPKLIGNSGIFAATAMGASEVKKRCRRVLQEFGYDPEDCFRIEQP